MKNKLFTTLLTLVFITAVVLPVKQPTLQQLSMCLHKKSHILKKEMKICTPENHQCMVNVVLKVCK